MNILHRYSNKLILGVLGLLVAMYPLYTFAQEIAQPTEEFSVGMIESVDDHRVLILSGPEKGKQVTIGKSMFSDFQDIQFETGDKVIIHKISHANGEIEYMMGERYRLRAIIWLAVFFVVLSVLVGKRAGAMSIIGLAVSAGILLLFVIPNIINGSNPVVISFLGSLMIACTSLYIAHGFEKRTSVALLSTSVTLVIAVCIDLVFVHVAALFGMGSEESVFLQTGMLQNIDMRGLLLGGIIIGCLGVLDDITTAQTAAIDEISKADPTLSSHQLRQAGRSVGKEHIASLINTLALAYCGASMPLLLLLSSESNYPFWLTINSEFFAEEIVRTLVGSCTLLIAVPISTYFAAYFLQVGGSRSVAFHGHHH